LSQITITKRKNFTHATISSNDSIDVRFCYSVISDLRIDNTNKKQANVKENIE